MYAERFTTRAGLALTAAALLSAAPAGALAGEVDLRSPDVRDAAAGGRPYQDLRSPDTRDAADGVVVADQTVPPIRIVKAVPGGFDGGDAAIGAGGVLGLVLITAGGGIAVTRRRAGRREAPAAVS